MTTGLVVGLLILTLFVFVFSGLPVPFAMGGTGMLVVLFFWGPDALYIAVSQVWGSSNQFVLIAIPLFIFMAMIIEQTGIAEKMYDMIYLWFGSIRGGLAVGTVIICAIFAAMCGISGTATITMGAIALPSMLKRKYHNNIAIGSINSGGGWGILMPPSVDMIIYALISGESVGRMFAGGVIPTMILLSLDSAYILIRSYLQPQMAPAIPKEMRVDLKTKILSLKAIIVPCCIIFAVLGSIVFGLASPTEAASIGVFGSLLAAWKTLTPQKLFIALKKSISISGMVMWIIFGAYTLSAVFQGIGVGSVMADLISYIPAGRWGVIIFFQIIIFLLAMVMSSAGIMLITLPIMLPIVEQLGFNTLWFGILFIVQMQIGYMTPPFGYNLFFLKALAPKGITMGDIYKSVIAFIVVELIGLIILMKFSSLVTWLPDLLFPITR